MVFIKFQFRFAKIILYDHYKIKFIKPFPYSANVSEHDGYISINELNSTMETIKDDTFDVCDNESNRPTNVCNCYVKN